MARQSETYHIDLINRRLEGERQYRADAISPKPRYNTNILHKLLEDLHIQTAYGVNPSLKELRPSLDFNLPFGENQRFNVSGGLNVPSTLPYFDSMPRDESAPQIEGQMMDWLINLGIDF